MTWQKQIVEQYGEEYILRQLAEESAELCQAALKLVRVMREETPMRWQEGQAHLLEEIADVKIMIDMMEGSVITTEARLQIEHIYAQKEKRMKTRMLED